MSCPHVVILGGGPAALGAAYRLRRLDRAAVTVLEQQEVVGGNAGSFRLGRQYVDYGSHRLHPACDHEILTDIREFLGEDLVCRRRHGRILLRGKWIHFPLKPLDLMMRLDPRFAAGTIRDMVVRGLGSKRTEGESFAAVLLANLGPTICRDFYFPYARKIWGTEPEEIAAVQARRRVSANSFSKLLRKVLRQLPGLSRGRAGFFYYPQKGFGQISVAYAEAAASRGAEILLGHKVTRLEHSDDGTWNVSAVRGGEERKFRADLVWSTLPVTLLTAIAEPPAPVPVREAASSLDYRAMLLVYLELPAGRFSEYDAHYFPEPRIGISRLSEPKNYSGCEEPRDKTTLCAEIPCSPQDEWWSMSDDELGRRVLADLEEARLTLPGLPTAVQVKRLRYAYPVYAQGYEAHFRALDQWADSLPSFVSFGRQGLFAHDNTHHALFMAYSAVDCLTDGVFDARKWSEYRKTFETHVVED